ncbi:hypothetical protein BGZ93_002644 [Podila epicladia]|nr:hypothetical protein BGZ92_002593 [Podila epicladia]KAG0097490.1 hypothetical protein BGZ93_002644 [Podila epicladia]
MVTDNVVLTTSRLLVATLLLPDTISFQVPPREKDGKFKFTSTRSTTIPTAPPRSPPVPPPKVSSLASLSSSTPVRPSVPATAISTPKENNVAKAEQPVVPAPPAASLRGALRDLTIAASTTILPPLSSPPSSPTSAAFFRTTSSTEPMKATPKSKSRDQDRPSSQQRNTFHAHGPHPTSILTQPPENKDGSGSLFPTAEPRPTLNQPRSRILRTAEDHPANHVAPRRTSLDSAKVFADATWTVEKANNGNIGLHNAVNSIQGQLSTRIWVGTLGMATDTLTDRTRGDIRAELALNHGSIPVFVNDVDFEGHYHQFCKQVLWPIFHYVLPDNLRSKGYEDGSWKHYVAVNRAFADTIVENYMQGDTIWVNDYHLMLVPNMIRERLPDASIGFFLHIPFPSSEIFRCLHARKEVLEGLLGADLIGFQTYSFARHFLQTCSRILSVESNPKGIQLENTAVNIGIFPIGIDTKSLNVKRQDPDVAQWAKVLKEKYAGKKLIVARDKMDYIKGVRQKMLAFERFLNLYPEWQGKIVLIQVALSTSEQNEVQSQVADVVTRINSRFSDLSYQPIVFLRQDITFSQYLGLLTAADLCLITSLRDGMNLTSHEYVVCQEEQKNPLVLSEFAGTYGSLGACLRVNPWNYTEVAEAIHDALVMGEEEKTLRWNELKKHVCVNTAQFWAQGFVSELIKVHGDVQRRYSIHIPLLDMQVVLPQYQAAKRRLLLLDYDGTLLPYDRHTPLRSKGKTSKEEMIRVVRELAQDPRNTVYIMSGRTRESLTNTFGSVEGIGLCAEGGCFLKPPGKSTWDCQIQEGSDMQWRKKVMEMFEYYKERTPGSEIEEKSVPLVWHYRKADNPSYGLWQARECQNHIEEAIGSIYPVHAVVGRKCLEVMPRDISKASATKAIIQSLEEGSSTTSLPGATASAIDFVLSVGDDRSDEDMFEFVNGLDLDSSTVSSPHRVVTCTVGSKSSAAHWFVPGVSSVLQGLQAMADTATQTVES